MSALNTYNIDSRNKGQSTGRKHFFEMVYFFRPLVRLWISAAVILVGVFMGGCQMKYSFSGADIPAEAKTFSVRTFSIRSAQGAPNLEQHLTEALKDLLLSQTRLNLAEKRGDLQYEGDITNYEISNAAVSGDEYTTRNRLTITVRIKYINTFETDKNFERSFSAYADYDSNQNFSAVEDQLVTDIRDQLTQDIFNASVGAW